MSKLTVAAASLAAAAIVVQQVPPGGAADAETDPSDAPLVILDDPENGSTGDRAGSESNAAADTSSADAASAGLAQSDPATSAPCHDEPVTADGLNSVFDAGVDGIVGADYQRAFELDDGRVLWVFQDAFIDDGAGDPAFVHNAGLIQSGMCFEALVGGTDANPDSWFAEADTTDFDHWYWPLDGYQRDEDTFVLFLAEMDERGSSYLSNATPVATWTVEIDLQTMEVGELDRAPNPNGELYGFEVTTDDDYLYLYAQCHRQFGFGLAGHDECAAEVYVARQPLGAPDTPLTYWNGTTWSRNSRSAVNIAPTVGIDGERRTANPIQVERDGDRWISVTKASDWWDDSVYVETAPRPEGPWTTSAVLPARSPGEEGDVASYFVSFVPTDDDGRTLAMSSNRWDGEFSEYYRPRFATISDAVWSDASAVELTADLWLPLPLGRGDVRVS